MSVLLWGVGAAVKPINLFPEEADDEGDWDAAMLIILVEAEMMLKLKEFRADAVLSVAEYWLSWTRQHSDKRDYLIIGMKKNY